MSNSDPSQPLLSAAQLYALAINDSPNTLHHSASYNTGGQSLHINNDINNMLLSQSINCTPEKRIRKAYTITRPRKEWTSAEHELFIDGVAKYERDWKQIYEHIGGTKTIVQIRSHAQKHFMKLAKKGCVDDIPAPKVRRKKKDNFSNSINDSITSVDQLTNNFENNNINGNHVSYSGDANQSVNPNVYSNMIARNTIYNNQLPAVSQYRSQSADVGDVINTNRFASLPQYSNLKQSSGGAQHLAAQLPPRPPHHQSSISPSHSMPITPLYPHPSNYNAIHTSANVSPYNVSPQPQYNTILTPPYDHNVPYQSVSMSPAMYSYQQLPPQHQSQHQGNYAFSNNEITNNTVDTNINLSSSSLQTFVTRLKAMNPTEQVRLLLLLSANDRNLAVQMLQTELTQQHQLEMPTQQQQHDMFNQQLLASNNAHQYNNNNNNYTQTNAHTHPNNHSHSFSLFDGQQYGNGSYNLINPAMQSTY